MPNTAFTDGQQVCNIFHPTTDCQTVTGGKVNIQLKNGEAKIYIPKTSSFFIDLVGENSNGRFNLKLEQDSAALERAD